MKQDYRKLLIKPIIPKYKSIDKKLNYHNFVKKGYRVIPEVEIVKNEHTIFEIRRSKAFRLVKIFKTLKYVRKLNLDKMTLIPTSLYLPKIMYFAKRMSNASIIIINDIKPAPVNYRGTTEIWPKFAKRAKIFKYSVCFNRRLRNGPDQTPIHPIEKKSKFLHLLRFQSSIKDLTIRFSFGSDGVHDNYWRFEKYPSSLERLAFVEPDPSVHPITPSSFSHLKNLKHLEIIRISHSKRDFQSFIFQLLSPICSQLQSLSLTLPPPNKDKVLEEHNLQNLKMWKHLTHLKLGLYCTKTNNFENVFKVFKGCSLKHLTLRPQVESEKQLLPVGNFIKQFQNLESLKLQVNCPYEFGSSENIKKILKQIDDLIFLKELNVSIILKPNQSKPFLEITSIFPKILARPLPLQNFQIHLTSFKLSNQGFLTFLQSLEPFAPTLKKLTISIGEYKMIKKECQTVLNFIRSLKDIRVLKLQSLSISFRDFLMEFVDVISEKPYIRDLSIGEVKETVSKPIFFDEMERIMQKRGLVKFFALASDRFMPSLAKEERSCPKIQLAEIKKVNPFLKMYPALPIFQFEENSDIYW